MEFNECGEPHPVYSDDVTCGLTEKHEGGHRGVIKWDRPEAITPEGGLFMQFARDNAPKWCVCEHKRTDHSKFHNGGCTVAKCECPMVTVMTTEQYFRWRTAQR